jgi:hypothetical protein
MAFNWENEVEKIHNALERAIEDRDVYAQESLTAELVQVEEYASNQQNR